MFKIYVCLEFRDEAIAAYTKNKVRDYVDISPLMLRTHLFVRDKDKAKVFLDIKYSETQAQWGIHGVDSDD